MDKLMETNTWGFTLLSPPSTGILHTCELFLQDLGSWNNSCFFARLYKHREIKRQCLIIQHRQSSRWNHQQFKQFIPYRCHNRFLIQYGLVLFIHCHLKVVKVWFFPGRKFGQKKGFRRIWPVNPGTEKGCKFALDPGQTWSCISHLTASRNLFSCAEECWRHLAFRMWFWQVQVAPMHLSRPLSWPQASELMGILMLLPMLFSCLYPFGYATKNKARICKTSGSSFTRL